MFSRRAILWLMMFATTIVVQSVSSSTAQASCGDYLIGHREPHVLPIRETLSTRQSEQTTLPLSNVPCNGPRCQKAPSEPLAPEPVQFSTSEGPRIGCLPSQLPLISAKQLLPKVDHTEREYSGHPSSIEHPPRSWSA